MTYLYPLFLVFFLNCVAIGQLSDVSLPIDEKFSPDAQVEYTKGQNPRSYVVGKIRGVEYRYFHDNSRGIIEGTKGCGTDSVLGPDDPKNWRFGCQKSENSGQKQCLFSREGIAIITYTKNQATNTWIASTNFRMDDRNLSTFPDIVQVDGVEVYNSQNKQFSPDAILLMRSGKVLTLHRGSGPEGVTTYGLYGFSEAIELCEWALKHIY